MKRFCICLICILLAASFVLAGCSLPELDGYETTFDDNDSGTTGVPEINNTKADDGTTALPKDDTTETPSDDTTDIPTDDTTQKPEEETTEDPSEETTAEPEDTRLPAASDDCNLPVIADTALSIISEGVSGGFKIVYASEGYASYSTDATYNSYKAQADALAAAINAKFGVSLSVVADKSVGSMATNKEILVGPTNREQSDKVMMFCNGSEGFVIKAHGKKLVINAYTSGKLADAMSYFIENYVNRASDNSFTFESSDDYCSTATYKDSGKTLAGYSYKTYTIVVSRNAEYSELRAAKRIQYLIASKIGTIPAIVYDNARGYNNDFEIRVGNTVRTSDTTKNVAKLEYVYAMNGASLEINAGSSLAMEEAMKYAELSLISKLDKIAYNSGEFKRMNTAPSLDQRGNDSAADKVGEIRLLVHNVWGWHEQNTMGVWGCAPIHYNSAQQRNLAMAELYLDLDADVIALQEYTDRLLRVSENYDISTTFAAAGYAQVYNSSTASNSATPIFYKTAKFELLESDVTDWRNTYNGCGGDKFMTVAVLRQKSDGKTFAVISVHLDYRGDDVANQNRINMARDAVAKAEAIRSEYNNCPVFICGDFNCNSSSEPYRVYTDAGFESAARASEVTDAGQAHLGGPYWNAEQAMFITDFSGVSLGSSSNSIDHIMAKGSNLDLNRYDILTDGVSGSISDHLPQVLDFDLN